MRSFLWPTLALCVAAPAAALPPCPPGALAAPHGGPALDMDGWTTIRPAPTFHDHIEAMATDGEVIWVLESEGRLHRYGGGSWEQVADLPGSRNAREPIVVPVAADEAWIHFDDRLWRWRAGEATEVVPPGGSAVEALIVAQGRAWILADGHVHRSEDGGWSSEAIEGPVVELSAVGGEPWAVDGDGALWRRGARAWEIVHWPACGRGSRLVGRSADDLYVVGEWSGVWHWDGASWSDIPWPRGYLPLGEALATTSGLVVHADWMYSGELLRWDGAHWLSALTPHGSGVLVPWGEGGFLLGAWRNLLASDGACAEVVTRVGLIREASAIAPGGEPAFVTIGGAVRRARDGAPLHAFATAWAPAAWGSPDATIWAATGQLHRSDAQGERAMGGFPVRTQWDEEERPDHARAIAGTADDDLWVGGYWGSVHHWNGERLVQRPIAGADSIASLWAPRRGEVWAAALWQSKGAEPLRRDRGWIARWDGGRWRTADLPGDMMPKAFLQGPGEEPWLLAGTIDAEGDALLFREGGRWALAQVPGRVHPIAAGGRRDGLWVLDSFPALLHFDGAAWTQQLVPLRRVTAAHLSAEIRLVAGRAGKERVLLREHEGAWRRAGSGSWLSFARTANGALWALGEGGVLARWRAGKLVPVVKRPGVEAIAARGDSLLGVGRGLLHTWDGARWSEEPLPLTPPRPVPDWGRPPPPLRLVVRGDLVAVASEYEVAVRSEGGSWGVVALPAGADGLELDEHGLLAFGAEKLECLRLRFGGPGWEACFERRGVPLDGGARLVVDDGMLEIEREGTAERLPAGGPRLLDPIAVKESADVAWIVAWDGVVRTSRAGLLGAWERPMPISQESDLLWDGEALIVGGNRIDRFVPPSTL